MLRRSYKAEARIIFFQSQRTYRQSCAAEVVELVVETAGVDKPLAVEVVTEVVAVEAADLVALRNRESLCTEFLQR